MEKKLYSFGWLNKETMDYELEVEEGIDRLEEILKKIDGDDSDGVRLESSGKFDGYHANPGHRELTTAEVKDWLDSSPENLADIDYTMHMTDGSVTHYYMVIGRDYRLIRNVMNMYVEED